MTKTTTLMCQLEIDAERSVVYVHSADPLTLEFTKLPTVIRISQIPASQFEDGRLVEMLDITHDGIEHPPSSHPRSGKLGVRQQVVLDKIWIEHEGSVGRSEFAGRGEQSAITQLLSRGFIVTASDGFLELTREGRRHLTFKDSR